MSGKGVVRLTLRGGEPKVVRGAEASMHASGALVLKQGHKMTMLSPWAWERVEFIPKDDEQ